MAMNSTKVENNPQAAVLEDPLDREYHHKNYLALGCGDVLLDVYRIYLESAPLKAEQLRSSLQAGNLDLVISLSHGLKGESGSVGGRFIMAAAAEMEKVARAGDLQAARAILPELEHQLQRVIAAIQQEIQA